MPARRTGRCTTGEKVGTFGDCAAFSLNQNKCLCSGEGGMFVTDNEEIAVAARQLWSFGETSTPRESRDYHAYALGWMYRNNDLTAAFGRAQLSRLDEYLAVQREQGAALLRALAGTPQLLLPAGARRTTPTTGTTSRPASTSQSLGWGGPPVEFRDAIVRALTAEGVPAMVWQHFILPAMTVFRAQNAYGHGCPWTCPYGEPVTYDPAAFPVAQRHCDTHFCLLGPLRAPQGREAALAVAEGIRKVFAQIDRVPVESRTQAA